MKIRNKLLILSAIYFAVIIPIGVNALQIVPEDCTTKGGTGCSLCDVVHIFTNAADIIAGGISGLALIMFIVGGFFLILSGGNEQRVETGKKILIGTIIGIGIVFLAWFLVNVVVRIAYQGANNTDSTSVSLKVFDTDTNWWTLPACDPAKSGCQGKYIGNACGVSGSCSSSSAGVCSCYRVKADTGDDLLCKEADSTDLAIISDASKKQCACLSACVRSGLAAGKTYKCVAKVDYEKDPSKYTLISSSSCEVPIDTYCVEAVTP